MDEYIVYTDGGYSISSNVGAAAYVILKSDGATLVEQSSFVLRNETSQRAEIKAILAAVEALPYRCNAQIFTDNLYASLALGKIPKRKNKPDKDLLVQYKQTVRQKKLGIRIQWVPSHMGNDWNEQCDRLCTEALAEAEG